MRTWILLLMSIIGPALFAKDIRFQPEVRGYVPLARRWTLALRATTGFLSPFPSSYGNSFRPGVDPTADDIQLVFDSLRVTRVEPPDDGDDPADPDGGGCSTGGGAGLAIGLVFLRRRRRR